MCKQPDILESEKIHFAVMAIETGAQEMEISPISNGRLIYPTIFQQRQPSLSQSGNYQYFL